MGRMRFIIVLKLDPPPYLNPVLIYDPKKPMPPILPHVRFIIPDNGREKMPKLSEEERKKIELLVQNGKIEKNKLSD